MKKRVGLIVGLVLALSFTACSSTKEKDTSNSDVPEVTQETEKEKTEKEETDLEKTKKKKSEEPKKEVKELNEKEFDKFLKELPLAVVKTKYLVQDEKYKTIYPDMLQAILKNNTKEDIKDAVVAFVAWDENKLPVKIKGNIDFTDGLYIKKVEFTDINMVPDSEFGKENGFSVEENSTIDTFKAIVVSYTSYDGNEWENPYFDEFCTMYEEKKLNDDMSVEVEIVDEKDTKKKETSKKKSKDKKDKDAKKEVDLDKIVKKQELAVVSSKYVVQDKKFKDVYPDMLQVTLKNNTKTDIKNAIVAFAAWDKNKLPVKIKGNFDFSDGEYIKQVSFEDINMVPDSKYGESSGFSLDKHNEIKTFKAIVVSYEDFDGETWENPHYKDFCDMYEDKRLK